MLRKILLGLALLIVAVIGAAIYLMHRYESRLEQASRNELQKLIPAVTTSDLNIKKRALYKASGLGAVTQILSGWPAYNEGAALTLVGNQGVHFLDSNAQLKRQIAFSKYVPSPVEAVRLDASGDYGFLTRDQSWMVDVILFDKSGKELWNYPGRFHSAVDDSVVGEPGQDGKSSVAIGFNGGGGLVLVDGHGNKLWEKAESNVWHVETVDIKEDGHLEILHTNARGELLVRTASGDVIGHYLPGYYVSHFSLTRWGNELNPTHLLVPTTENKQGCCKKVLLVLDSAGNTVADLTAPDGEWIRRANGTSMKQGKNAVLYTVLQSGNLPRSLLSVFNSEGKITYQEVLDDRCLAMHVMPGGSADRLLIGCTNTIWEYSLP